MLMSTFTFPDIQRSSPVTVPADTPVLNVFQPVAETAFTDAFRNPVDRIIISDQVILYFCHADKPGFSCVVDQRSVTSPAVWVAVLKFRSCEEKSSLVQILKNHRVCFFTEDTRKRCLLRQFSLSVYKLYKRHIIAASHLGIVFTECRCNVNDSGSVCQCNIGVAQHVKCFLILLFCCLCSSFIEWNVFFAFQLFSCIALYNFIGLFAFFLCKSAEHLIKKCLCHIIYTSVSCIYFHIGLVRIYTESHVGRQCPRRCCPCKNISVFIFYLEAHDCGTLFYVLVSLRYFLRGKRCSAARAVRNDLKSFVKKSFLPDLL